MSVIIVIAAFQCLIIKTLLQKIFFLLTQFMTEKIAVTKKKKKKNLSVDIFVE